MSFEILHFMFSSILDFKCCQPASKAVIENIDIWIEGLVANTTHSYVEVRVSNLTNGGVNCDVEGLGVDR